MKRRPMVLAFDVIETMFPLEPLKTELESAGLSGSLLPLWFARILRDGFALDSAGRFTDFKTVASSALRVLMDEHGREPDDRRAQRVLQAFGELPPAPDVRPAFERLRSAGVRIFTLSNGGQSTTQQMMDRAGLTPLIERVLTIDQVRRWKPAREVYLHAVRAADVAAEQVALVAAHAWDCQGADAAGLTTGFVQRKEKLFAPSMPLPTVTGGDLDAVVTGLLSLPAS